MQKPDYIPQDYSRVHIAHTFDEVARAPFGGLRNVNCHVLPRDLPEECDFKSLALLLGACGRDEKVHFEVREEYLAYLAKMLKDGQKAAADYILRDMQNLSQTHHKINLRVIFHKNNYNAYVYGLHADSNSEKGRLSCVYTGRTTEGVRNEDAFPLDDLPAFQKRLAHMEHAKKDGKSLSTKDQELLDYHHLFYVLKKGAKSFAFKPGDLFSFATEEVKGVEPYLHRAPRGVLDQAADGSGQEIPRLLLIADPKP